MSPDYIIDSGVQFNKTDYELNDLCKYMQRFPDYFTSLKNVLRNVYTGTINDPIKKMKSGILHQKHEKHITCTGCLAYAVSLLLSTFQLNGGDIPKQTAIPQTRKSARRADLKEEIIIIRNVNIEGSTDTHTANTSTRKTHTHKKTSTHTHTHTTL